VADQIPAGPPDPGAAHPDPWSPPPSSGPAGPGAPRWPGSPGPPGPPGPARPAPPRSQDPRLRRRAFVALGLGLSSPVLVVIGGVPFGLVAGVVAIVLGRRVRHAARAADERAPAQATVGLVGGVVGCAIVALVAVVVAVLWPQVSRYVSCERGAITTIAQQACQSQLQQALQHRFG